MSNGFPSNSDFSNTSAANLSSTSISKFWSLAQNLTRSVFTRASTTGSQPAPASSSTRQESNLSMRNPYDGYVSNDEEDVDGNYSPEISRRIPASVAPEMIQVRESISVVRHLNFLL